jgi:hypothetical protein
VRQARCWSLPASESVEGCQTPRKGRPCPHNASGQTWVFGHTICAGRRVLGSGKRSLALPTRALGPNSEATDHLTRQVIRGVLTKSMQTAPEPGSLGPVRERLGSRIYVSSSRCHLTPPQRCAGCAAVATRQHAELDTAHRAVPPDADRRSGYPRRQLLEWRLHERTRSLYETSYEWSSPTRLHQGRRACDRHRRRTFGSGSGTYRVASRLARFSGTTRGREARAPKWVAVLAPRPSLGCTDHPRGDWG